MVLLSTITLLSPKKVLCGADMLTWNDFEKVEIYFSASLRDLHQFKELPAESKTMLLYIDRHLNQTVFMRGFDKSSCKPWRSEILYNH